MVKKRRTRYNVLLIVFRGWERSTSSSCVRFFVVPLCSNYGHNPYCAVFLIAACTTLAIVSESSSTDATVQQYCSSTSSSARDMATWKYQSWLMFRPSLTSSVQSLSSLCVHPVFSKERLLPLPFQRMGCELPATYARHTVPGSGGFSSVELLFSCLRGVKFTG